MNRTLILAAAFAGILLVVEANDSSHVLAAESSRPDFWDAIPLSSSTVKPGAIRDGYWRSQFERVNQTVATSGPAQ